MTKRCNAHGVRPILILVACVELIVPTARVLAHVPSGIAGVVKDTSGAVMPGVTVEASSPALIEKVRTAVTDSQRFSVSSAVAQRRRLRHPRGLRWVPAPSSPGGK